jgi:tRNA pseudouridine38-40 synthase
MRIAACVEYNGRAFCGWQSQKGVCTVQDCVEKAISTVADHGLRVTCAGRTDTGVHAVGQVIHFETRARRSMRSWVLGSNANLPETVCLKWAKPIDERFHARFSAISRRYRYIVLNRWIRPAVLAGSVTWCHRPLDEKRMQVAAKLLVGEHDFTTFRALACQSKTPVRNVYAVDVSRRGDCVYIDVHANAFLHHMVRNIAGVLIAIGKGERPPSWVSELLELRDRARGGVTAPPEGLYLVGVEYEARFELPGLPDMPVLS